MQVHQLFVIQGLLAFFFFQNSFASEDYVLASEDYVLSSNDSLEPSTLGPSQCCDSLLLLPSISGGGSEAIPLASRVNSHFDDFLPCYNPVTGRLWFTSNRSGGKDTKGRGSIYCDDLYIAEDWGLGSVGLAGSPINILESEGAPALSADGQVLIFGAFDQSGSNCALMESHREGAGWSYPIALPDKVNSPYWDSHPSFVDSLLIFASNRPGGFGGTDLYGSSITNGKWSEAENLGSLVNSINDERAPCLAPSNQYLYFSSNGHGGYGSGDFFLSILSDSKWQQPCNLPAPINSAGNEQGFALHPDLHRICFSSRRIKNDYDIYEALLPDSLRPIQLPDFISDPIVVDAIFQLPTVQFAFGSAELREEAGSTLLELLQFLEDRPAIRFRIEGHADEIGTARFNEVLSLKRAQAIRAWLIESGVKESRLECAGFGSRFPIIEGRDEGARGKNRRTELRVLSR